MFAKNWQNVMNMVGKKIYSSPKLDIIWLFWNVSKLIWTIENTARMS